MISKRQSGRDIMAMVWMEDLVPKEHLLRKIDAAVDFDKLRRHLPMPPFIEAGNLHQEKSGL